jgi:hypothetical protein
MTNISFMIKVIFSVITLFLFTTSVHGQKFRAGVIAGITATQISGDNLGGFDKPGFAAGGMVSTPVSGKFDIAMEILFFQKGSKKNPNPDKGDYDEYNLRLNYFEVPVLIQWLFSKRFTFEAGPTFGALLSSKEEDEYGEVPDPRPFDIFELGIAGGMKVNFAQKFSGTFRIETSVLPVREHQSGVTEFANRGQFNAALLFALQYTFKKKNE